VSKIQNTGPRAWAPRRKKRMWAPTIPVGDKINLDLKRVIEAQEAAQLETTGV